MQPLGYGAIKGVLFGGEIFSAKFVDGVEVGAMSGNGQARQLRRVSLGHGPSPGTTIPHNHDYLAISKHARATIANLNSHLNNKALFTRIILQYSAVYFNRVLSLFISTRALGLRGPNSKCASFISLIRVYRSSLLLSL